MLWVGQPVGHFGRIRFLTFDCLNKVRVMLQCHKHENMNEEAGESDMEGQHQVIKIFTEALRWYQ